MKVENRSSEAATLARRLTQRFRVASSRYGLIADGDRILVGLSGGKDSLCMLELLARQSRIYRPRFHVEALHVRIDSVQYEADASYLSAFCESVGVPLHVVTTSITPSAVPSADELPTVSHAARKPMCFLCSWNRRKQFFNFAQEHGFNKIALGHHQDDLLHTALLNLTFQGHFSTMPVRLEMRKMPLTIIRPLATICEADIRAFAQQRGYQPLRKTCPYETATRRTAARELMSQIEALNPEARYSLWHALEAAGKLVEA